MVWVAQQCDTVCMPVNSKYTYKWLKLTVYIRYMLTHTHKTTIHRAFTWKRCMENCFFKNDSRAKAQVAGRPCHLGRAESPSVAEGLRSATFLGIVSWKRSRCQLPKDPTSSIKECGLQLEALGRHAGFWAGNSVTIFGLADKLIPDCNRGDGLKGGGDGVQGLQGII
jgi:hypothetical protein